MNVDVAVERTIGRPRAEVVAYASDPDHVPAWYRRIDSVEWQTPPPVEVGSRITFRARFLGRDLVYTYEVTELIPGERLVMRTAEGPFPMSTTYTWSDAGTGATAMTLRNQGSPSGFSSLVAPVMRLAMRRAMRQDLARLASILEAP